MTNPENSPNTTSEADKWRRRERSMLGGLIIWALAVGLLATYAPERVAEWITTYHGIAIAGMISISVGLSAGVVDSVLIAVSRWKQPSNDELTAVPWEEDNEQ